MPKYFCAFFLPLSLSSPPPPSYPIPDLLNTELQQLGLPKENSDGVSRPFRIHRERLRAQARADAPAPPRLISLDWRVDAVVASSALGVLRVRADTTGGSVGEPLAILKLGLSHGPHKPAPHLPAPDSLATPLLLASAARHAMIAAAAAREKSPSSIFGAMGTSLDAAAGDVALLSLQIIPLGTDSTSTNTNDGGLLSPTASAAAAAATTTTSTAASPAKGVVAVITGGDAAAARPRVKAQVTHTLTLSARDVAALVSELKIAAALLDRVAQGWGEGGGV